MPEQLENCGEGQDAREDENWPRRWSCACQEDGMTLSDYVVEFPVTPTPLPTTSRENLDTVTYFLSLPRSINSNVSQNLHPDITQFYSKDEAWIFRNLITHEYVLTEAITTDPSYIQGPRIEQFGFGEVVFSRTCWSSDENVVMAYEGNIHYGV